MGTLMDNIHRRDDWSEEFYWQMRIRVHKVSLDTMKCATLYFASEQDAQKWLSRQMMMAKPDIEIILESSLPIRKATRMEDYKDGGNFS